MTTTRETRPIGVAVRQATREVVMYRQSNGWVLSSYDPAIGRNRTDDENENYSLVRERRTVARAQRAVELILGRPLNEGDPGHLLAERGQVIERVRRFLSVRCPGIGR